VLGYQPLLDFLRQPRFELVEAHPGEPDAPAGNLLLFAYDWRLSNRYTATCLKCEVEEVLTRWRDQHPGANVTFICHSNVPEHPYPIIPVVGIGQPTLTTAVVNAAGTGVDVIATIEGQDLGGDGTVPRLSARPKRMTERDPSIRGVADGHGALSICRSVLDQLDLALSATDIVYRAPEDGGPPPDERTIGLSTADVHEAGEPVEVTVHSALGAVIELAAFDETNHEVGRATVSFSSDTEDAFGRTLGTARFERLDPGGYVIAARDPFDPEGSVIAPVRTTTLVWGE
jgi:hypothetical protein